MSVDDRQIVVVIFLADKTARILTEGTDLVFERLRIADELRFIQNLIDILNDFIPDLHAHTDIDCARLMRDVMLIAQLFQPVRTASAGCVWRAVIS